MSVLFDDDVESIECGLSERDKVKVKMEDKVLSLLQEDEKYCGDDVHSTTQVLFAREYGIMITEEQIKFIATIERSRRKVLALHPELDKRKGNGADLEERDRKYYSKDK